MDGVAREGLVSYEYKRDRLVAVVPRGHELRARQSRSATAEVRPGRADSSAAMMRLLSEAAAAAGQPLRLRVQVKSFEAVCKLVQANMGIGVLPEAAASTSRPVMGLRLIRLTDDWADAACTCACGTSTACRRIGRKLVEQLVGATAFAISEARRDQILSRGGAPATLGSSADPAIGRFELVTPAHRASRHLRRKRAMSSMFIGGKWVAAASGETIPVLSPVDGDDVRHDRARPRGRRRHRGARGAARAGRRVGQDDRDGARTHPVASWRRRSSTTRRTWRSSRRATPASR